jgi:trimethylamine--corrinoid protein Co-methyltransferase
MSTNTGPRGRRGGGREARRSARLHAVADKVPFITRTMTPLEVCSAEGLELIEHNADTILEQVGIEFRDPDALATLAGAGAEVDGERVRFPRGMARSLVQATAPREFIQHARDPANDVRIGGDATVFAPAYGSPFVRDLDGGRRYGTIEDFRNFVKLAYLSPYLHHSGGTVCEPVDLPVNKRHLDMVHAHLRYSDKPFMGSVTHPDRARDTVAMARIVFGADRLERDCVILSLVNANSPLVWDATMLGAARAYAEANQAVLMTPFILAGAMSPVTVAGAATQTLAEALAGMAYVQLVRPGAPMVFGSFASSMSMQSGAPTFGTPEPALVLYTLAACARRLGVPFRSGGALTASKLPDAQAAYESANTMQPTLLAGVHFVLHVAGWLEGGLTMGYEKFVLDADQAGAWHAFARGIDLSDNGQALQAILDNGPGQHFLGTPHTLANFETAFYRSSLADNNSFEQWEGEGSKDAAARANTAWKQALAAYQPPPIDEAVDEELRDWIARRKASFPDSNV